MDNNSSVFDLQPNEVLDFSFTATTLNTAQRNQFVQDDDVLPLCSPSKDSNLIMIGKKSNRRRRQPSSPSPMIDDDNGNGGDDGGNSAGRKKQKIIHRDIERQRRHEMSSLYQSVRELLPMEYIKGKRSISDQLQETVKYIKHLKEKIQDLNKKRDALKKQSPNSAHNIMVGTCPSERAKCSSSRDHHVTVVTSSGKTVEVFATTEQGCGLHLSRLLEVLIREELKVVSCISRKVNSKLLHHIQAQANDGQSIDQSELQQKLTDLSSHQPSN